LERAADTPPELEHAAEPRSRPRVQLERADRLGALSGAASGVDDGQAIEPPAHLEPGRERGRGCGKRRRQQQERDYIDRPGAPLYTPRPMSQRSPDREVDWLIIAAHKRFVKAMDGRLDIMSPEIKETYFSVLSKLVTKLESEEKGLREIAQEMMTEAMSEVLQMMQG